MHTLRLDKYTVLDALFKLDWQKSKDKDYMVVEIISMFRTAVDFFPTCQALKAWFKLSRVNLYRNYLKGNENYFELTGSKFELSRVRVTEGKTIVDLWRKSRGNRFWFVLTRVAVSVLFGDNSRYSYVCAYHKGLQLLYFRWPSQTCVQTTSSVRWSL